MPVITLEDVVRDGIDDGFKQVVAQLTKNRIDGTMGVLAYSTAIADAVTRRDSAIASAMKVIGVS